MKITAVKTYLVHPGQGKNWLFVKVETDSGLYGWGEAYTQADRDRTIEIHVQQLARYLVGRSPFQIKRFTYIAYTDYANKRGSMELYCAISGIEHALWDIVGKALDKPVYALLGGQVHEKLRSYTYLYPEPGDATDVYADPELAATALNATVEDCVRQALSQYQWEYRRFKQQPDQIKNALYR